MTVEQPVTAARISFLPSSVLAVEITEKMESSSRYLIVQIWMRGQTNPIELKRWLIWTVGYTFGSYYSFTEPTDEQKAAEAAAYREHLDWCDRMLAEATVEAEALRDEVTAWLTPIEVTA